MSGGLGDRITRFLQKQQMTQKDLAEKAGVTEAAISHYIKGDRSPRAVVLGRIADALEVSLEDLMNDGESSDNTGEIRYAIRLLGRNAAHMTEEDKMKIAKILLSDR